MLYEWELCALFFYLSQRDSSVAAPFTSYQWFDDDDDDCWTMVVVIEAWKIHARLFAPAELKFNSDLLGLQQPTTTTNKPNSNNNNNIQWGKKKCQQILNRERSMPMPW